MAKYLGRWTVSDVAGIGAVRIGPSGRFLRSPIDAVPRRRGDDQAQPKLLCKIGQNGQSGDWEGQDAEGRPLIIQQGAEGLEVFTPPGEAEDQAATDPEIIPTPAPGAASLDQLRKRFGARAAHDTLTSTEQAGRMQAWQKYLNQIWAPRS
jgi:hypothetical protein